MSLGYTWEKLYNTVRFLATSKAGIQERVRGSFTYEIQLLITSPRTEEDVPEDMWRSIKEIQRELEEDISDDEAENIAGKMFSMFCEISKKYYIQSTED